MASLPALVAQAAKSVPPTQASEFAHVTRLTGTLGNLLVGDPFGEGQNLLLDSQFIHGIFLERIWNNLKQYVGPLLYQIIDPTE